MWCVVLHWQAVKANKYIAVLIANDEAFAEVVEPQAVDKMTRDGALACLLACVHGGQFMREHTQNEGPPPVCKPDWI